MTTFRRGNALALVLVVSAGLAVSMFSMHFFVSNRALQVRKTTMGMKQGELALQALLDVHNQCLASRPDSQSKEFSLKLQDLKAEVFVEERVSDHPRWIGGKHAGKYQMLDSLHYLAQVCEDKKCWVAVAEEVFSPEPIASHSSFDAYDWGLPSASIKPIRTFSYLNGLSPGEWKVLVKDKCSDLKDRDCRISLFETLRLRNRRATETSYAESKLALYLQNQAPFWPVRMEEEFLFKWMKTAEPEDKSQNPEIYWMAGTKNALLNFKAPAELSEQEISIRGPADVWTLTDEDKNALKTWFNLEEFFQPQKNFQEIHFHQNISALKHLSVDAKWDATLYAEPKNFPLKMSMNRGLSVFAMRYSIRCSNLPIESPRDLLKLKQDFQSDRRYFYEEGCSGTPLFELEIAASGEKLRESPRVYVGERPWLTLQSLWLLYSKLGGAPSGRFPETPSMIAQTASPSVNKDETNGYMVFPVFVEDNE